MSFFPFPPPETLYGRGCLGNGEREGVVTYIKKGGIPRREGNAVSRGGGHCFFCGERRSGWGKKSSFLGFLKGKKGSNPLSSSLNFASLLAGRPVKSEKTRIIICMPKKHFQWQIFELIRQQGRRGQRKAFQGPPPWTSCCHNNVDKHQGGKRGRGGGEERKKGGSISPAHFQGGIQRIIWPKRPMNVYTFWLKHISIFAERVKFVLIIIRVFFWEFGRCIH